jgi:hypothetical protein
MSGRVVQHNALGRVEAFHGTILVSSRNAAVHTLGIEASEL